MSIPVYSSEIRWFSKDKSLLKEIFDKLPGNGIPEKERTDYYLLNTGADVGIKIREDKHEIKHLCTDREPTKDLGPIEHWVKWSTDPQNNILNTIPRQLMRPWLAVTKSRQKKKYGIHPATGQFICTEGRPDDGCGVEHTQITIGEGEWYSLGLEAFGTYHSSRKNLLDTIEYTDLKVPRHAEITCMGYPEFLKTVLIK